LRRRSSISPMEFTQFDSSAPVTPSPGRDAEDGNQSSKPRRKKQLSLKEKQQQMRSRTEKVDEMIQKLDPKPMISYDDIISLTEFLDADNSGEVDEEEFFGAVRKAKRGEIKDEAINSLMVRVDNELRVKQIKFHDLFTMLDTSGDGSLSIYELREGLNMLCDVSWEKEIERKKLRREAAHGRWKEKEDVRDATKRWISEVESLPEEFVKEHEYFCRDIHTPQRFERYLQIVVNGTGKDEELVNEYKSSNDDDDDDDDDSENVESGNFDEYNKGAGAGPGADAGSPADPASSVNVAMKKPELEPLPVPRVRTHRKTKPKASILSFAYDITTLEDESVHTAIKKIVDDEISVISKQQKRE